MLFEISSHLLSLLAPFYSSDLDSDEGPSSVRRCVRGRDLRELRRFLRQWPELQAALQRLKTNDGAMDDQVMGIVADGLAKHCAKDLCRLLLDQITVGNAGMCRLAAALPSLKALRVLELNFDGGDEGRIDDLVPLADAIGHFPLASLRLEAYSEPLGGFEALCEALGRRCPTLLELDMREARQPFGNMGKALGALLRHTQSLIALNLANIESGSEALELADMFRALADNRSLRTLDLSAIYMEDDVLMAFGDALAVNTMLCLVDMEGTLGEYSPTAEFLDRFEMQNGSLLELTIDGCCSPGAESIDRCSVMEERNCHNAVLRSRTLQQRCYAKLRECDIGDDALTEIVRSPLHHWFERERIDVRQSYFWRSKATKESRKIDALLEQQKAFNNPFF
jgi:hypothetical protein